MLNQYSVIWTQPLGPLCFGNASLFLSLSLPPIASHHGNPHVKKSNFSSWVMDNIHWISSESGRVVKKYSCPQREESSDKHSPRKLPQWDWEGLVGQEQLLGIRIPLLVLFKSFFRKLKTTALNTQEQLSPTPVSKTHWFNVSPLSFFKSGVFYERGAGLARSQMHL